MSVYLVTGAGSGIGKTVADRLSVRGDEVVRVTRDVADLSRPDALEKVTNSLPPLKGFVHCAGFDTMAPLSLVSHSLAAELYAVHVIFPMRFLGWMGRLSHHVDGAAAVLVSSSAAHEPVPGNAAYAAAKGAVEALGLTAKAELAPRGVRVEVIAPGAVDTRLARSSWMAAMGAAEREAAAKSLRSPESVAEEIISLL